MILLGFLVVVTYIPEISTYLPNLLFGKADLSGNVGNDSSRAISCAMFLLNVAYIYIARALISVQTLT